MDRPGPSAVRSASHAAAATLSTAATTAGTRSSTIVPAASATLFPLAHAVSLSIRSKTARPVAHNKLLILIN
jgi:hypothetical protein